MAGLLGTALEFAAFSAADSVFGAVNNYLKGSPSGSPSPSSSPIIPTSRKGKSTSKTSLKQAKKEGLSKYAEGIGAGLVLVAGGVEAMRSGMLSSAVTASDSKVAENAAHKVPFADSPLLNNQILLKESIQDIVDAINANTITSATFLAPISANLSAISSTLIAISSTLLEISDNYSGEIASADDLPYIDSQTFYDLLSKGDVSQIEIMNWKTGEQFLVNRLSSEGASYSEIKQAVNEYRKSVVPASSLLDVGSAVSGISQPAPVDSTGKKTEPAIDHLAEYAKSAKILADFKITPQPTTDLDGNPLSNLSPMQLEAVKHASDARHKTDTNNQEYDDTDFNSPLDFIPSLPFIGRQDVFNPSHTAPTSNPWIAALQSKFSGLFS